MVGMTSTEATTTDRGRTTVSVWPSTKHALFQLKKQQADTFDDVIRRLVASELCDSESCETSVN